MTTHSLVEGTWFLNLLSNQAWAAIHADVSASNLSGLGHFGPIIYCPPPNFVGKRGTM